jgi:hypothetical protein
MRRRKTQTNENALKVRLERYIENEREREREREGKRGKACSSLWRLSLFEKKHCLVLVVSVIVRITIERIAFLTVATAGTFFQRGIRFVAAVYKGSKYIDGRHQICFAKKKNYD